MVAEQNRVTPSPLDFGLWALDLDLDCDNIFIFPHSQRIFIGARLGWLTLITLD